MTCGSTVVYKFNHMFTHVQKIQSSITISTILKKSKKKFKVQLQLHKVEKNSKKFQSPVQVN